MMNVHEYLVENSIADNEFQEILKDLQQQELADEYSQDLFGVESVVEAINERDKEKPKKGSTKPNTKVTNVSSYELSASQLQMF